MEHIRGATFRKLCTYQDDAGVTQDLTNITISSEIRSPTDGTLISRLTVTKLNQVDVATKGKYLLEDLTTDTWPETHAIWDIRYSSTNNIDITPKEQMPLIIIGRSTES